jgi:RNA polymerase sigma-70 factor, ECF subfamily
VPAVSRSRAHTRNRNVRATGQRMLGGWLAPSWKTREGNVDSQPPDSATPQDPADARALDDARDRKAVARVRRGDQSAFNGLVECYMTRIHTHLYRLAKNREEAEDLTQETFIRAYRFLPQFDAARSFRSWLYAIATNTGLNALRARGRRISATSYDEHDEKSGVTGQDGREEVARQDLNRQVADAVTELPERAAMLVHLHYFEGFSLREAGEIVGLSENAAKVALHRARKQLREQLVEGMEP